MEKREIAKILGVLLSLMIILSIPDTKEERQNNERVTDLEEMRQLNEKDRLEVISKFKRDLAENNKVDDIINYLKSEYTRFGSVKLLQEIISNDPELSLQLLTSDDTLTRKIAILALTSYSPAIFDELARIYSSADVNLKNAIILHLARSQNSSHHKHLFSACENPQLRLTALKALQIANNSNNLEFVLRFLNEDDPIIRFQAFHTAISLSGEKAQPLLKQAARDSSWKIRELAMLAASRNPGLHSSEILLTGLKDKNEEVRVQSLKSLGILKASQHLPRIIKCLTDPSAQIRGEAAMSLILLNAADSASAVRRALEKEELVFPLRRMIIALSYLGQESDIELLARYSGHKHQLIREEVRKAIVRIKERVKN